MLNLPCYTVNSLASKTGYHSTFDHFFKKYTQQYFGNFDWRIFKAQAIVESGLNPYAISIRGAAGMMQIMPFTWNDLLLAKIVPDDIVSPNYNVKAGIYYNKHNWKMFANLNYNDRIKYMLGAYNAGAGAILKAQKLCNNQNKKKWSCIEQCLPKITGKYAQETIKYVSRVLKIRLLLE